MGTKGRWRTWLVGLAVILAVFGLAWWNNPVNVGGEREGQRVFLALGLSSVGLLVLLFPLALREKHEIAAQKTLIIVLALVISICVWWVGYLPSDPFGCSRVDAPDCHTNAMTRWRALGEGVAMYAFTFGLTHAIGGFVEKRRTRQTQPA